MDKCTICKKYYGPNCEQEQCPNNNTMIKIQPKDTSKGHFYTSLVKSGFRILAGLNLAVGNLLVAGVLFIIAESLGILEEVI